MRGDGVVEMVLCGCESRKEAEVQARLPLTTIFSADLQNIGIVSTTTCDQFIELPTPQQPASRLKVFIRHDMKFSAV